VVPVTIPCMLEGLGETSSPQPEYVKTLESANSTKPVTLWTGSQGHARAVSSREKDGRAKTEGSHVSALFSSPADWVPIHSARSGPVVLSLVPQIKSEKKASLNSQ
jgi:hypothetical protein